MFHGPDVTISWSLVQTFVCHCPTPNDPSFRFIMMALCLFSVNRVHGGNVTSL